MSPDDPEKLRKFRDAESLTFPILLDPDNRVSGAYGLINESNPVVPHPTTLIVDEAGVVRHLRVDEDYKVRPSAKELAETLDELGL